MRIVLAARGGEPIPMRATEEIAEGLRSFRLQAAELCGEAGLAQLESLVDAPAASLRTIEVVGDAPAWTDVDAARLAAWGRRLALASARPGEPWVGWADGRLGGPALELLLACDVLVLAPGARLSPFPPSEGYRPVAGGLGRLLRRGGRAVLAACLEAEPIPAERAVELGLAAGCWSVEHHERFLRRLRSADPEARGAVTDLARRGRGIGRHGAEALERALFAWCFAGGKPRVAIEAFRGERSTPAGHSGTSPEEEG